MFENILLAVDGSDDSLRAAAVAGNLARSEKTATVRVLTVYDSVPGYLGDPNQKAIIAAHMEEAERILQAALGQLGAVPGEVDTEVLCGSAAEEIVEAAQDRHADLIVMGSRGKGRLLGILGSHSHKVASHAPCPVLLVR